MHLLLVLTACQRGLIEEPIRDESTAEERILIEKTLAKISDMAAQYGYNDSFTRIPVSVTTEDIGLTGRTGFCIDYGTSRRIVINRMNFPSQSGQRHDLLFHILLHEIGHCYFNRPHTTQILKKPGHYIYVEIEDESGGEAWPAEGFPLSAMFMGSRVCAWTCPNGAASLLVLRELQNYFVAEMIGIRVLRDPSGIDEFKSLKWVEAN